MTSLPIQRIILYKHGVGYFERRGSITGQQVRLSFARPAMDDMLKSLVALDLGAGQVLSVDFETPEDRDALLAKGSIHLSDDHSLLDLLRDLRGREVRCQVATSDDDDDDDEGTLLQGMVVGVDYEATEPLKRAQVVLYQPDQRRTRIVPLGCIRHLDVLDDTAAADLSYFLRATQSEADRRSATLHLSEGDHDLLVGYIAPAPAWRVSYRVLYEASAGDTPDMLLLQGWGLFDNQLEEDLEDVRLTLVAGMPVSFRYRLYEPYTPERPLIEDEDRTINAPLFFESAPPAAPAAPQKARRLARSALMEDMEVEEDAMAFGAAPASFSAADMGESVQASASGSERGALFAYEVSHPVSVARGQSAMVPILSQRITCRRELLYNSSKLPHHPVASLRLDNETGLTLERGPVTVLENGIYAGEAVVPFTLASSELIVPFAVELGIKVEEQRGQSRHLSSLRVRADYLLIEEYDIQRTSYHLTSTLSQPASVTLEHHQRSGYELSDTPPPQEQSASFMRWEVECAPNSRTVFEVRERRLLTRREQVRSLTGKQLQRYLANNLLDNATASGLQELLDLYGQIQQLQERVQRFEREREAIYRQQKQIQGNLEPLGREGDERVLRVRYVTDLNRLEDRLAKLATDEQQVQQQIEALEQQASEKLQALGEDTA